MNFTDKILLERKEGIKEKSVKKKFGLYGITAQIEAGVISLSAEKPLSLEEWYEIIDKNLR